jgi:hypothetical protein
MAMSMPYRFSSMLSHSFPPPVRAHVWIVWPACRPAASDLACVGAALAPAPLRPARPSSGAGCVPSVCADFPEPSVRASAFPACPPACGPSRLSLLSGSPLGSPPAIRLSFIQPRDSFAEPRDSPTGDPARAGANVCRCLPGVRACQVWGLGVQHRRRHLDDFPPFSTEIYLGFGQAAEPLVVLRNYGRKEGNVILRYRRITLPSRLIIIGRPRIGEPLFWPKWA